VNFAPVALFVYNRPIHTRQTVEALLSNSVAAQSALYVFSDAPRDAAASQAVDEVRSYIRSIAGFKSVTFVERETNYGLARSIIDGVTELCDIYGRAIVLEDDLVTSPYFLTYMNNALECYENEERVMQVSGHIFQVPEFAQKKEALFLPFVTSWGWGTWARAWKYFDPSAQGWEKINSDSVLRRRFNLDGHFDYSTLLEQQRCGKVNSWAIRWYLSVFFNNGVVLFPPQSLVRNIGLGGGTHGSRILRWTLAGQDIYVKPISLPQTIGVKDEDFILVQKAIFRQMGGSLGALLRRARMLLASSKPEACKGNGGSR
jgi:GT2 family glycosyltransferase